MKRIITAITLLLAVLNTGCAAIRERAAAGSTPDMLAVSDHYAAFGRAPLQGTEYAELPLGAIKPEGWLKEQLLRQASGLTGHLDEVYPQVMGPSNAWLGGDGDAWERGPYWIDGLLPLACILDDSALKAKVQAWVEAMLDSQQENGYFGPAEDHTFVYGLQRGKARDWWPKMVALKILKQYYMATGDTRVTDLMLKYFRYQLETLPETPLDNWSEWGRWRGADELGIVYWLYNLTGQKFLLLLGEIIHEQTAPWADIFTDGSLFHQPYSLHCVNLAQGFKAPVVHWLYSGSEYELAAPETGLEKIRATIGIPNGLWAGDELIHASTPSRGSELCTAVEMMYSLEEMLRLTGNHLWGDWLERVAYNALPTQINDDFTAKQYYQQTNQIACTRNWRPFSTPHDDTDVVFGTLNGYPCCLSNMHQGWPKFTQNLWYATVDGGMAALVYAPSSVTAELGGESITLVEETAYPFMEEVTVRIVFNRKKAKKATFPLRFRIPEWADGASIDINGVSMAVAAGKVVTVEQEWHRGDVVKLRFPMKVRVEKSPEQAWSILRGPLVYALRLDEQRSKGTFTDKYYGPGYEEVRTSAPWNYCLMRDSFSADDCIVEMRPTDEYPWNLENAPVSIYVKARELPSWKEYNGSTGDVPYFTEDGNDTGAECELELIPYGCTTLRIAAFPTRIVPWDLDFRRN